MGWTEVTDEEPSGRGWREVAIRQLPGGPGSPERMGAIRGQIAEAERNAPYWRNPYMGAAQKTGEALGMGEMIDPMVRSAARTAVGPDAKGNIPEPTWGQLAGSAIETGATIGVPMGAGKAGTMAAGLAAKVPYVRAVAPLAGAMATGAAAGQAYETGGALRRGESPTDLKTYMPGWKTAGGAAMGAAAAGLNKVEDAARTAFTKDFNTLWSRAFSPKIASTGKTAAQGAEYYDKARFVVNDIAKTQEMAPETVAEMTEAVQTGRRNIWARSRDLMTKAGEAGARITTADLEGVAGELEKFANMPAKQLSNPNAVEYAKRQAENIRTVIAKNPNGLGLDEIEDAIMTHNANRKAFLRSGEPHALNNAAIEEMQAHNYRRLLDQKITALPDDPTFRELKEGYGAYASVEKDINNKATVMARRNAKGLLDMTDVYTAGKLVTSLASGEPASIAGAATSAIVKGTYKHLNNPDTAVKRMFKLVKQNPVVEKAAGLDIMPPDAYGEGKGAPPPLTPQQQGYALRPGAHPIYEPPPPRPPGPPWERYSGRRIDNE